MRPQRRGFVEAARWAVHYILICASLSDHRLLKQTSCVSRHQGEYSGMSKMAVAQSSKHFAGVRNVWIGTL
jgi:hypothetical protein